MGSGCSRKSAVGISSCVGDRQEELAAVNKQDLLADEESEQSFLGLTRSTRGSPIRWTANKFLGAGAFARVYFGVDTETRSSLAVKHFQKQFNAMKKEISVLRTLDHPHIVKYYQTDLSDDFQSIHVLLEYVPGNTLKQLMNGKPVGEYLIKFYMCQLLKGLTYLHSHKVIHRDLKPANIMITPGQVLKLIDFDLSRQIDDHDHSVSESVKGTPYWMAPEIALKAGHSYACDIWSVGCILVEMITGQPPWANLAGRAAEVLAALRQPGATPDIPASSLKDLIVACLDRDPSRRPTAESLLKQFEELSY